ncbi:NAD(P)-dependent oxidoreductase [Gorillibacterium massiliense]|uniref:NAD(P)-dependent oxidoreductase n=1 Tax=Gorillibacterium massiliense TaxID=1280390 RepID=UPI0004B3625F|nr:NAD(P)-dependent oxidoreductase [Gorillibacterium massiliense]
MKIGVIGATGKAGNQLVKEAMKRGHDVTAIVRNALKLDDFHGKILEKDLFDLTNEDISSFDAIINAFAAAPGEEDLHVKAGRTLIEAVKGSPKTRLIVVGGAGSLFTDEGHTTRLMDTADFPPQFFQTAYHQGENLKDLQGTADIDWTFVSPSAFFDPTGKRTGAYQQGKDELLVNSKGSSYISYPDYAIAIVDEIENPQHRKERFTVVGEAE